MFVFDFDGVICNSIHDSFMTALNSYIEILPDHLLPLKGPLPAEAVFSFEENHEQFFREFSLLLPLGNFAEDYYVLLCILENDRAHEIKTQAEFDAFKRSLSGQVLSLYQEIFYRKRHKMQKADPDAWSNLLPPFDGIPETIRSLSQHYVCAIATSKDHQSVDILLRKYKLTDCFQRENILDKEFAESKRDHLTQFHEKHNVPFKDIHFIDDKVSHLIKVKDLGVQPYLAVWGFNTEREHEIALEHGFKLLRLEALGEMGKL